MVLTVLSLGAHAQELTDNVNSIRGLMGCYEMASELPLQMIVEASGNAECEPNGIGLCERKVAFNRPMMGMRAKFSKATLIAQNPAIGMALLQTKTTMLMIDKAAYGADKSIEAVEVRQILTTVAGFSFYSAPMLFNRCQ